MLVTMGEGKFEALPLPPVKPTDETNKETTKKKSLIQFALTAHSKLCTIIELKVCSFLTMQEASIWLLESANCADLSLAFIFIGQMDLFPWW
jgi:hypothetical protein